MGKAITGEVLPRTRPRRPQHAHPAPAAADEREVTAAAVAALSGLPIYAATVADTGIDPHASHTRWQAALAAWWAHLGGGT